MGTDNSGRKAYLAGSGIVSLSAAAYLVKEGGLKRAACSFHPFRRLKDAAPEVIR